MRVKKKDDDFVFWLEQWFLCVYVIVMSVCILESMGSGATAGLPQLQLLISLFS